MEARLPKQKLAKACDLITTFIGRKKITLHELQSLTGYLAFCAKVVPVGRSFLRRLYDATANLTAKPSGRQPILISADMQLDLHWWQDFLPEWNGIPLIRKDSERAVRHVWPDASGTKGQGAFFTNPGVDHRLVSGSTPSQSLSPAIIETRI